ncbi:MAG TPA: TonB-dependent receptor [Gammaproteobacteria bacterium]|nr:TonB-dependent receptor [Gammaproteobacteria bacterium]
MVERLVSRAARASGAAATPVLAACVIAATAAAQAAPSAFDLSIEELGQIQVTTASRRAETLSRTPASVYVITSEDIRRSGVTSIMQALRLAPGVEVARNGSSEWTISIRGFSSDLSNKLLVLIDGRSAYSPLFAGVFWDVQDTLLEDIDRIEIVSGPGGSVWGANAVNGVINIITKSPSNTLGTRVEVGAGNEEQGLGSFRYGWQIRDGFTARAYAKYFDRDASELVSGGSALDGWHMTRAGTALEWRSNHADEVNVHADVYEGAEHALLRGDFTLGTLPGPDFPGTVSLSGGNVIANWLHRLDDDSNWRLQFYFDHSDRQIPGSFDEARDTYNVAFLHDLRNTRRHDAQWGAEYRTTSDHIGNTTFATFVPPSRSDQTVSAFVQDRIAFGNRLFLTLGAKFEHNDYTGFEDQPNARVTWLPSERQTVWAAVSRAVRVPARLNTDLRLLAPIPGLPIPAYVNVNGSADFASEDLTAYEAGYRVQVSDDLSLDLAAFDNYYDNLQTMETGGVLVVPGPPAYLLIPAVQANLMEGETYGGTFTATWQPTSRWRLQLQYAHLQMDLESKPGGNDAGSLAVAGNSPKNQITLQSFIDLSRKLSLYTSVRHVDELPSQNVPSYLTLDWNLAWTPTPRLRASLTVQSANDAERLEFGDGRKIERSAFARFVWTL